MSYRAHLLFKKLHYEDTKALKHLSIPTAAIVHHMTSPCPAPAPAVVLHRAFHNAVKAPSETIKGRITVGKGVFPFPDSERRDL